MNQIMGDGIMALFGAPLAHEDHAVRACYAALRMQESIVQYAEAVVRSHGVPIQIRVGLNSGEVVVRAIESDLHMDYTAVGQTTHLAARMEQMATPGTVLMAPATMQFAEGHVEVVARGPVLVKGLADPVEIYQLHVRAIGTTPKPEFRRHEATGRPPQPHATRRVWFDELPDAVETPIYERSAVPAGTVLDGPAIIDQLDSTTLVPPGWRAEVDEWLNIRMHDVSDVAADVAKAQGEWYKAAVANASSGGQFFGVPMNYVGGLNAWRVSMFKDIGLTEFPKTWDAYRDAGVGCDVHVGAIDTTGARLL